MDRIYGRFGDQINCDEKRLIPHIKRFMECAVGDPEFYAAVLKDPDGSGHLLESRGIYGVDSAQALSLLPKEHLLTEVPITELAGKPQALLWRRFTDAVLRFHEAWRKQGETTPSRRFNAWRQRQVNRCQSQLGAERNKHILHGTIAFELSKGCSMGCPFCGLAAEPLQEVFMYTAENARFWRDVLHVVVERLGASAGTGVCYWATEPSDNPDYIKFVADFGKVTGVYPQTTTAAPTRNPAWTGELLQLRREHYSIGDRFSILSVNALRRLHQLFSAEDLALTEVLLQHAEPIAELRARSGRNRKVISGNATPQHAEDHTIACLTGYLVNMVDRTARLISPCPPSNRWPLGYRIHAEGSFSNAAELDRFIGDTIEKCMPEQIAPDDVAAFRRDLEFNPLPEGFQLRNTYWLQKMAGSPHLAQLGRLIAQGNLTSWQVTEKLMDRHLDVLAVMASMQTLFDRGLLEDDFSEENFAGEANSQ